MIVPSCLSKARFPQINHTAAAGKKATALVYAKISRLLAKSSGQALGPFGDLPEGSSTAPRGRNRGSDWTRNGVPGVDFSVKFWSRFPVSKRDRKFGLTNGFLKGTENAVLI